MQYPWPTPRIDLLIELEEIRRQWIEEIGVIEGLGLEDEVEEPEPVGQC